jgi:hypothetical protein
MSSKNDDIVRYLQATSESDHRLIAEAHKGFGQNLLICFAGFVISVGIIFYFDLSITSRWGFVILLFPIYFLVMNVSELCQNMVITTIKIQELIRLNASHLEYEIERNKGASHLKGDDD